jgi:hypothetical protein
LGEVVDVVSAIDTVTLFVPELDSVTVLGLNVQVVSVGKPEQVSATVPLKPFCDPSERVAVPG